MIPFPDKKYEIIYADPPWKYNASRLLQGEPERHYPTMTVGDMKELPIGRIKDKNCLLFLWFTSPKMPEALEICESWGFKFATIAFVWEKQNAVAGSYTMSSVE